MSLYGDGEMLTDPEYKALLRSGRGGGSGPVGGGGGFAPLGGGGGGGLAGSLNMTAGGGGDALRTLLRRRMRPPGSAGGPSYLAGTQMPQTGALGTLLGGGKVSGGMDTSGLSKTPTMTSYGRMTPPGGGSTGGTGGGGFGGPQGGGTGGGSGGGSGGTWDPNDPNSAPSSPWANGDNGFLQNLITILGRFNATGAFTPNGSSAVSDMTRSNAVSNAQAMLDRNKLTAQSLGTDPATAASYALQSGLRGQSDVSNAVTQSALQQLFGQQKFGQGLLSNYLSGVFGNKMQQQNNGTDWGAILQGIGSIIPG